jgi:hypothetical protein
LEEELLTRTQNAPLSLDAELEYRTPAQPGAKRILASGDRRWIVSEDGEVHASLLISAA